LAGSDAVHGYALGGLEQEPFPELTVEEGIARESDLLLLVLVPIDQTTQSRQEVTGQRDEEGDMIELSNERV
jgi:hypothetical protein